MEITRVFPLLVYRDIGAARDFLVNVFGLRAGMVYRTPDGTAVHGEVHAGPVTIWLHALSPEHQMASPEGATVSVSGLCVNVDDVDAHYRHTLAAGAKVDYEPVDRPYGQREYGVRDSEGHRWWFSTPIPVKDCGV